MCQRSQASAAQDAVRRESQDRAGIPRGYMGHCRPGALEHRSSEVPRLHALPHLYNWYSVRNRLGRVIFMLYLGFLFGGFQDAYCFVGGLLGQA